MSIGGTQVEASAWSQIRHEVLIQYARSPLSRSSYEDRYSSVVCRRLFHHVTLVPLVTSLVSVMSSCESFNGFSLAVGRFYTVKCRVLVHLCFLNINLRFSSSILSRSGSWWVVNQVILRSALVRLTVSLLQPCPWTYFRFNLDVSCCHTQLLSSLRKFWVLFGKLMRFRFIFSNLTALCRFTTAWCSSLTALCSSLTVLCSFVTTLCSWKYSIYFHFHSTGWCKVIVSNFQR